MTAVALSPLSARLQEMAATTAIVDQWQVAKTFSVDAIEVAQEKVAIADMSASGKLLVQGTTADVFLAKALAVPIVEIGKSVTTDNIEIKVLVCRLRRDLFFISTASGDFAVAQQLLNQQGHENDNQITVTDVTHGRSELRLVGPESPNLMTKVCGLNFDLQCFVAGDARQTSVAKTKQLVIRQDVGAIPAFSLIGGRSLGAYLWDILMQAGADLGIKPLGFHELHVLSEKR